MKLQIAIDLATSEEALAIVEKIHDIVDIVEVGTPMIIREGLVPVRLIKEKYPNMTVLADTKIVDGGDIECAYACEAGADIVTVLAFADNETVKAVTETAHKYGKLVMADLICITDIPKRAKELEAMGIDLISVHTAVDVQKLGKTPLGDLKELVSAVPASMSAVAGGVNMKTIASYKAENPAIIIAGGSLTNANDIRAAAKEMKEALL
jgi:3-hexulose-6-phosphate synthase